MYSAGMAVIDAHSFQEDALPVLSDVGGEGFRTLWEKHNPLPDFVPTGYMYQVEPRNETKKECVTFFLQGPFF